MTMLSRHRVSVTSSLASAEWLLRPLRAPAESGVPGARRQ